LDFVAIRVVKKRPVLGGIGEVIIVSAYLMWDTLRGASAVENAGGILHHVAAGLSGCR